MDLSCREFLKQEMKGQTIKANINNLIYLRIMTLFKVHHEKNKEISHKLGNVCNNLAKVSTQNI